MSVMLANLGAALLWFGWFGFNAGSAFGANAIAGLAFLAIKDNNLLWDGPLKETGSRIAQFGVQIESVVIVSAYTAIGTIIVYFITLLITRGARVSEEEEIEGLDEAIHGEKAINL